MLLDMSERVKDLKHLEAEEPLRAAAVARRYDRAMPEKDMVIDWRPHLLNQATGRWAKQWSKAIQAEINKISGLRGDALIKDDVPDAFSHAPIIGLRPPEEVDRSLSQDRPRVRLFRPGLRFR